MANQNYYRCLNPEEELQSSGSNNPPRRHQRPQNYVKNETPLHSPLLGASRPPSARSSTLGLPHPMPALGRSSLESKPSIHGYDNYISKRDYEFIVNTDFVDIDYPFSFSCYPRSLYTSLRSVFCYDPLPYIFKVNATHYLLLRSPSQQVTSCYLALFNGMLTS